MTAAYPLYRVAEKFPSPFLSVVALPRRSALRVTEFEGKRVKTERRQYFGQGISPSAIPIMERTLFCSNQTMVLLTPDPVVI